jgi:hypothetical protein
LLFRVQAARIEDLGEGEGIARSLYEMEIERINFQLRSYLRTRLEKISRMVSAGGAPLWISCERRC